MTATTSKQLRLQSEAVRRDQLGNLKVLQALRDGGPETKASALVMGLGNMVHKQAVKGLLFLAVEIAYIAFMVLSGFHNLYMLGSLGTVQQQEVWNEELQVYLYTKGDQSILLLLYGVATILLSLVVFWMWRGMVKSAYKAELCDKRGWHVNTFGDDLRGLLNENLYRLMMTPAMFFIGALTILPLVFMICMAFTNYFAGMVLAIIINRKGTKAKGFWRFCFVISCAVPMFVSLLIMRTMLQPEGAVNVLLRNLGLIAQDASLPFFTNATWARITVIVINIWVGVPYTLLQLTGVLQNIPADLYEAADIDGASKVQQFFKITLPYMFYVTTPYLIATFTGNVNNFNVIYLLSEGRPITNLASTAGSTDLLVTWLYKLTIDKQYYNIGAVVGILTFVILAIGSLLTYRNSKSYKEEGGF